MSLGNVREEDGSIDQTIPSHTCLPVSKNLVSRDVNGQLLLPFISILLLSIDMRQFINKAFENDNVHTRETGCILFKLCQILLICKVFRNQQLLFLFIYYYFICYYIF